MRIYQTGFIMWLWDEDVLIYKHNWFGGMTKFRLFYCLIILCCNSFALTAVAKELPTLKQEQSLPITDLQRFTTVIEHIKNY